MHCWRTAIKTFCLNPQKLFTSGMDGFTGPYSFTPLRRTALKRVKVTTSGRVQQVPAKRQNRGPGNSTGDGF
jgi:single-strand DNA-binding protein|uniref:Single-strand DNA binding protein n=3 Tax=Klebsiella pneumoniae TaxID=573 RepID=W8QFN2_KLEPN|nr:Single-stranded DNA-binding protein [Klebsiella pneumoniae]AIT41919.1 single-strand DNA binding protein [Klebsiella pneumoniae]